MISAKFRATLLAILFIIAPTTRAATHTNVIILLADDLGYADIGCQAIEKDVKTPNIDSIAAAGVRFTSAYVSCPVCSPSRAGILTGKYQERFGHEANPLPEYDKTFGLPTNQITLADEFRRSGYATAAFGKWHEGDNEKFWPLKRGFDEFFGFLGGMHAYVPRPIESQGVNVIRRGNNPVEEKEYLTDAITREAVSFIDRHRDKPFFMYVAYNAVHVPQQAPPRYLKRFPEDTDKSRRLMLAMLAAEDDGVGKILTKLHDEKLDNDTLVIFLSDNGGPTWENASRNAPLRGFKGQVWEGGIRIPFMMKWPGKIPAAKVINQPIISLDIFPTALTAAGATPRNPKDIDGKNILPLVTGIADAPPHPTLYWRFKPQWAIRDGNYKLETARDGITHLYDLSKDESEQNDLMKSHPEIAANLQKKYDAWNATLMNPLWPGRQEGANAQAAAKIDQQESTADAD